MLIILKDADFSANNIGTVTVPRVIDPFTLNAIELSGNESMNDVQKSALDKFFEDIGAFGTKSTIWSKLDTVFLPMICTELAKSCVDYKTGAVTITPDSSWLQLRNHGIARIPDVAKGTTLKLKTNYVWNWGSKSAFVFNTEDMDGASKIIKVLTWSNTYSSALQSIRVGFNTIASGDYVGISGEVANTKYVADMQYLSLESAKGQTLKGLSSNGVNAHYLNGSEVGDVTLNSDNISYYDSNPRDLMLANAADGTLGNNLRACGAIILGSYLTQQECGTLGSAIGDLWTAFNV